MLVQAATILGVGDQRGDRSCSGVGPAASTRHARSTVSLYTSMYVTAPGDNHVVPSGVRYLLKVRPTRQSLAGAALARRPSAEIRAGTGVTRRQGT